MLTTMTEEDWTIVLKIFEASRSRRGDKGRNDRKFLEALQYFVVHNITWRALLRSERRRSRRGRRWLWRSRLSQRSTVAGAQDRGERSLHRVATMADERGQASLRQPNRALI